MNLVRTWTTGFVLVLGLALVACARPTATPDAAATAAASLRATQEYAHGALIQTPTPTTGPEAAATGRALPRDPTAEEMHDGEHFTFVRAAMPGSPAMLVVNPAVMFGGDEADAASIADGHTTERHSLMSPFYIRDLDAATVTLPVSPTAAVELVAWAADGGISENPMNSSVETFMGWFWGTPIPGAPIFTTDRTWMLETGGPPMYITTANGIIVRIVEQYLP